MNKDFLSLLDRARGFSGIPWQVTSGYRCEQHNKEVGGAPESDHLEGLAADIKCISDQQRFLMVRAISEVGIKRIIIYPRHLHLSFNGDKPQFVLMLGHY